MYVWLEDLGGLRVSCQLVNDDLIIVFLVGIAISSHISLVINDGLYEMCR